MTATDFILDEPFVHGLFASGAICFWGFCGVLILSSPLRLCVKVSNLSLYFVTFLLHSLFVFSRSRPRKLDTEDELYNVALRALMRRAHSVHEMKQKLERRTDSELLIGVVMARLKENGQLDDQLYAQQFTRSRTQSRKQGQFRIQRELRARGVSDSVIKATLEESATQNDPAATVRQRIERKLKSYRGEIDDKKIASIYGSLLRAGFPSDLIRAELKRVTSEEVPEPAAD